MKYLALFCLIVLSCVVCAQDTSVPVNPSLVLQECTQCKAACVDTQRVCTEYNNNAEEMFSWTGLKVSITNVVGLLAVCFTVFVLSVIYRFIHDYLKKKDRSRFEEQLVESNKTLLSVLDRVEKLNVSLSDRVSLLEKENRELVRKLDMVLPAGRTEEKKRSYFWVWVLVGFVGVVGVVFVLLKLRGVI